MKEQLLEEKKEIEAKIKKAEEDIHFLKIMLYWEKKKLKLVSDQLEEVEEFDHIKDSNQALDSEIDRVFGGESVEEKPLV